MPAKTILKMGNPMLYQIAEPVDDPTRREIAELISDMRDSLDAVQGNGLAAPQIGVNLRVVLYRMPERIIPDGSCQSAIPWTTMINPTIKQTSLIRNTSGNGAYRYRASMEKFQDIQRLNAPIPT